MIHPARTLLLLVAAASLACASGHPSTPRPPRVNPRLITTEELRESRANTAMDAIQFLRPNWLQRGGALSMRSDTEIAVYLNDSRLGGVETLRSLEVRSIETIRFYDGPTAQARFGLDNQHGAIQVTTVAGGARTM